MSNTPAWMLDLVAVAAACVECAETPYFEIGLVVSGREWSFSTPPPRIANSASPAAWIEGSDATFQQIVDGSLTPQQAFLAGAISCKGDPEAVLRFTALLELCAGSRRQ